MWLRVVVVDLLAGVLLSFELDVTLSTLLLMFDVHVSFIFTLIGCIHITWSFNHIISLTFQPIPSLEINDLRVSLDKFLILDRYSVLAGFTAPCHFILG